MTRRIVQLLSHSIEAHDMLRLYHALGHDAFDVGGYIDPAHPHDPKRPALPEVPFHPDLKAAVDGLDTPDNLRAAQEHLPDAILDWADTIVMHHYLERMVGDWPRLRDWLRGDANRRIIWRTVGQSAEGNEAMMTPLRHDGVERVAYSPKEANIPGYCGHDAIIRFYKDPAEWNGWTGDWPGVINITQHLRQRDPYTNWGFWADATRGLARPSGGLPEDGPPPPFALALGPGSEVIGGTGELSFEDMQGWLRRGRCYLYTGTQPASYTLGLIEAMMTGIPVVSIGPSWMQVFPYGPDLFEGHEIAQVGSDDPAEAMGILKELLGLPAHAKRIGEQQRARAIELFGFETIRAQWAEFLA